MYEAWELQKAAYSDLNGNITGGVYDHTPTGTDYPYTVIGEETERPEDTHDEDGSEHTLTLHIWSKALGSKEVKTIMKQIDARWHHGTVSVTGARCYKIEREFSDIKDDTDPEDGRRLRHGVVRYRFSLEAT